MGLFVLLIGVDYAATQWVADNIFMVETNLGYPFHIIQNVKNLHEAGVRFPAIFRQINLGDVTRNNSA